VTIRVLVVDDSATIRQALCTQLKERGIETDTARNGNEALDKLTVGHGFDVVITDLKMPGIVDGERLIDTLKRDAGLSSLPVIVVTAFSERDAQLRHLEQGAAAFFGKPWDADVLAVTVRYHARQKSRADLLASDSRTDALTGLGNRRNGVTRLQEEIDKCRRNRRMLSVVMIDIDHFKRVNDTHGHPGGDDVLRHVAQQLRSVSRSSDVIVRWGGEEFLFVFPETDLSQATQIVDRFRAHLAAQPIAMPSSGAELVVTISGGAAELEARDTPESLVARADEALYKAKESGRNRLVASQAGELFPVIAA
jgi:two-component system, cell cycle response regulator